MTRSEREQLIERYLREDLNPAEEENFFIEAATDKELRFDLKASRVVENAFRKDREAAPAAYGTMRTHLAGLLAANHAEAIAPKEESPKTEPSPAARKPASRPSLGWIVTAASIGLVSLTSLLIGILAIDGDDVEMGTPPLSKGALAEKNFPRRSSPPRNETGTSGEKEISLTGPKESDLSNSTDRKNAEQTNRPMTSRQGKESVSTKSGDQQQIPEGLGKPAHEEFSDTTGLKPEIPFQLDLPKR